MQQRLLRGSLAALMVVVGWQAHVQTAHSSMPAPRVVRWQHGDPPIRLLPAERGFCYVSGISGNFAGGGEAVRVYVDDGSWYIGGQSCQPGLWVEATCITWPVAPARAAVTR